MSHIPLAIDASQTKRTAKSIAFSQLAIWLAIFLIGVALGALIRPRPAPAKPAVTVQSFDIAPDQFKSNWAAIEKQRGFKPDGIEVFTKNGRLTAIEVRGEASEEGLHEGCQKVGMIFEALGVPSSKVTRFEKWSFQGAKHLSQMSFDTLMVMGERPHPQLIQDVDGFSIGITSTGHKWLIAIEPGKGSSH